MFKSIGQSTLSLALLTLLLLPLIIVFIHFRQIDLSWSSELSSVLLVNSAQALASATASLVLGAVGGAGLLWLQARSSRLVVRIFEFFVLLPNAVPVLFLLLSVEQFIPQARGLGGIVFVHVLLNAGLVALSFARATSEKLVTLSEVAWQGGAKPLRFWLKIGIPLLRRDLGSLFAFVFALSFCSFAVPLAIGGSRATTLEVLIYQKIRISADWSQALGLSLMQVIVIALIVSLLGRQKSAPRAAATSVPRLCSFPLGNIITLIAPLLLLAGLVRAALTAFSAVSAASAFADVLGNFSELLAGSVFIGVSTGLLIVFFLLVLSYAQPSGWQRKLWLGFSSPSSVLVGFSLLILFRSYGLMTYFKIILGLVAIQISVFYRYEWDALLGSIEGQVTTARILGAGPWLTFRRVIFPQVARSAFFLGGLASLWAWGDFSLSAVVAERNLSLAMQVRALMDSYRFRQANVLSIAMICGGMATFFLLSGAGYVLGAKSETKLR